MKSFVGVAVGKRHSYVACGMTEWGVPRKEDVLSPLDPEILLLGINPEDKPPAIQKYICTKFVHCRISCNFKILNLEKGLVAHFSILA